jgi:hypothetical protein
MSLESPTNFIEANALLAMQSGDETEANECLEQLLPGELRELAEAASRLAYDARRMMRAKYGVSPGG